METALMLSYSQIVQGGAQCAYCASDASLTISTGADPDPVPMCWTHAGMMIEASFLRVGALFGAAA